MFSLSPSSFVFKEIMCQTIIMLMKKVHPVLINLKLNKLVSLKRSLSSLHDAGVYELSSDKPCFTLSDLRQRIPRHLFKKNTQISLSYFLRDVVSITTSSCIALYFDSWYIWPVYWFLQGSFFWALFNIGHDCVHHSFSNNQCVNDVVGLISDSFLLVPFHGFRASHRIHHTFHAHPEKDESWKPLPRGCSGLLNTIGTVFRTKLPFSLLSFPVYLWFPVSHFDPRSKFFAFTDKRLVMISNVCIFMFLCVLYQAMTVLGVCAVMNLYFAPYVIFCAWLSGVSYLHHHGSVDGEPLIPWYRGSEWSYLRGSLSSVDRDYGVFNELHHNIGTHVVHHIFPEIPHYNLVEATKHIKEILGSYYRIPVKCQGWFPFHLIKPLVHSFDNDHTVPSTGDVVYYE